MTIKMWIIVSIEGHFHMVHELSNVRMFSRAATANATFAAINSRKVRLEFKLVDFYCKLDKLTVDHICDTPLLQLFDCICIFNV